MGKLGTVVLGFASLLGCASPCPPCRCLEVAADDPIGLTLPYTLDIDDGIRCDVVSGGEVPEVLRCYVEDPTVEPNLCR